MKCQSLLSEKNKKTYYNMSSAVPIVSLHVILCTFYIYLMIIDIFNSFGAKFQTFVVCFSFLKNYRLKISLYVKLKD